MLQDVSALQLGAAGIGLSADADFGVHRLVVPSPEAHAEPVYPFAAINGACALAFGYDVIGSNDKWPSFV